MTSPTTDEIRDLLARAMGDAPVPRPWADVERRAMGDAPVPHPWVEVERRAMTPADDPMRSRRLATRLAVAAAIVLLVVGAVVIGAENDSTIRTFDQPATSVDDEQFTSLLPAPTTAIPLVGADDDPAAQAAFAVVELAFAAHNAGDMEIWAFWRDRGGSAVDYAYDVAAESRLEVTGCTYRGLGEWLMDEPVRGHGFDCETTLDDLFFRSAGVEFSGTYNWVVAEDLTWSWAGSSEDPEVMAQVMRDYRDWLEVAYPDVESGITWAPRFPRFPAGFPLPDSIPAAVEYIDEFVADSDVYPLTSPVPPREEWDGELVPTVSLQDASARDGGSTSGPVRQPPDAPVGPEPE